MIRKRTYIFVNEHWIFDEHKYPILKTIKLAKNKEYIANFELKHVLLHMQEHIEVIHILNSYYIPPVNFFKSEALKSKETEKWRIAMLEMMCSLLKIEGIIKKFKLDKHNESINSDKNTSFYTSCKNFMRALADCCKKSDRGENLDIMKISIHLDKVIISLQLIFNEQDMDVPWKLVPSIMKNK